MADIAASDLTWVVKQQDIACLGKVGRKVLAQISLGDGALTYPSGGVPIAKGKLGAYLEILSLLVIESNASGYVFEFDKSTSKLRIFEQVLDDAAAEDAAAHEGVLVELDAGSDAPAAMVLQVEAIVR